MDFVTFFEEYGFDYLFWYVHIKDGARRGVENYTFKDGSYFDKKGKLVSIAGKEEFKECVACFDYGFALTDVLESCTGVVDALLDNTDEMNALLKQPILFSSFPSLKQNTIYFIDADLSSESHFMVFVVTKDQVVTINTYGGIQKMVVKRNSLQEFHKKWFQLVQMSVEPHQKKFEDAVTAIFESLTGIAGTNPPYFLKGFSSSRTAPLHDGKKIVECAIKYITKLEPKPVALRTFISEIKKNQSNANLHQARMLSIGLH